VTKQTFATSFLQNFIFFILRLNIWWLIYGFHCFFALQINNFWRLNSFSFHIWFWFTITFLLVLFILFFHLLLYIPLVLFYFFSEVDQRAVIILLLYLVRVVGDWDKRLLWKSIRTERICDHSLRVKFMSFWVWNFDWFLYLREVEEIELFFSH